MTKKRLAAIKHRWREIAVYACLGAAAVLILAPALASPIRAYASSAGAIVFAAPLGLLLVYALRFGKSRGPILRKCVNLVCYPSAWVAAAPGLGIVIIFAAFDKQAALSLGMDSAYGQWKPIAASIATFVAACPLYAIALHALFRAFSKSPAHASQRPFTACQVRDNFTVLEAWIASDEEVRTPEHDAFGHARIAERIAARVTLAVDAGAPTPTQAIVGPRGSGKSTIIELVRHKIESERGIGVDCELVSVSLWPYESPEAAVRGILDRVIDSIRAHANTLALAGIPREYVDLLDPQGSLTGMVRNFRTRADPRQVLEKLDAITSAIDLHIVLCVEDLERFATDDGAQESDSSRLSPICSLLYLLDRMAGLTVITASDSISHRFDIDKLARHVERPPQPSGEDVWSIIRTFRSGCLALARDAIDPADRTHESFEAPAENGNLSTWLTSWRADKPTAQLALATAMKNPRHLKSALRDAMGTWSALKGEIDLDDLLAISALRANWPDLVAHIDDNLDHIRSSFETASPIAVAKEAMKRAQADFENAIDQAADSDRTQAAAIRALLIFLFPTVDKSTPRFGLKPQGVVGGKHTDYWKRALRGALLDEEMPDQRVLRAIVEWKTSRKGELAQLLADGTNSDAVENFGRMLLPSELPSLISDAIAKLRHMKVAEWQPFIAGGRHPAGIVALSRMARWDIDVAKLFAVLEADLPGIIGEHLPLACEIAYWFIESDGARPMLDAAQTNRLRQCMNNAIHSHFGSGDVKLLRSALQDGQMFTLYHAAWGIDRIRANEANAIPPGEPFAGWRDVGASLLELSERDPAAGIPQLLPFITHGEHGGLYSFLEASARALFDYDRMAGLLRSSVPPSETSDGIRQRWEAARAAVLAAGTTGPGP